MVVHALDSDYDEYVKEVLEEDAWHHDEDNPYYEDPPPNSQNSSDNQAEEERLRRKQEEEIRKQQAEAERLQRQRADEAFAREMAALSAEEQKVLRKKRRKDEKLVQGVLNASQRKDYYAVLGLRWFFPEGIRLIRGRGKSETPPSKSKSKAKSKFDINAIKDVLLKLQWPDWIVLRVSARDIQKAYRKRSIQVHPDKNRDPRTEQAFVAVQDAHAVLSDPRLRKEYEQERQQHRLAVRQAWRERYHKLVNTTLRPMLVLVHKVLGPMTVPIVVLVALLF